MAQPIFGVSVVVGLLMPSLIFSADVSILPEALRAIAKQKSCSEVADFFKRPGLVDPPYVIGYLPGSRDESAAFWCTRANAPEKYLLVITGQKNKCPGEISWQNYPGGLTVVRKKMKLTEFFYRDDVTKKGPTSKFTVGPILRDEYDGVGAHFYCHEGKWLVHQFH